MKLKRIIFTPVIEYDQKTGKARQAKGYDTFGSKGTYHNSIYGVMEKSVGTLHPLYSRSEEECEAPWEDAPPTKKQLANHKVRIVGFRPAKRGELYWSRFLEAPRFWIAATSTMHFWVLERIATPAKKSAPKKAGRK